MPYIDYDENKKITGVFANPQYESQTFLDESSDEYQTYLQTQQNTAKKTDLQSQITALDIKSIRAMREGGSMPDGKNYLDYYTEKISSLRTQLNNL